MISARSVQHEQWQADDAANHHRADEDVPDVAYAPPPEGPLALEVKQTVLTIIGAIPSDELVIAPKREDEESEKDDDPERHGNPLLLSPSYSGFEARLQWLT